MISFFMPFGPKDDWTIFASCLVACQCFSRQPRLETPSASVEPIPSSCPGRRRPCSGSWPWLATRRRSSCPRTVHAKWPWLPPAGRVGYLPPSGRRRANCAASVACAARCVRISNEPLQQSCNYCPAAVYGPATARSPIILACRNVLDPIRRSRRCHVRHAETRAMPATPCWPIGRCLLGKGQLWSMLAHCLPYDDNTTDPRASAAAYASTDIARTQNLGSHN